MDKVEALQAALAALFKEVVLHHHNKKKRRAMRRHQNMAMAHMDAIVKVRKRRFIVWDEVDAAYQANKMMSVIAYAKRGGVDPEHLKSVMTLLD